MFVPKDENQLLFVVFSHTTRFARLLGRSVKHVQEFAETSYFEQLRREKRTQKEIADEMGMSLRKAASLAKGLRETMAQAESEVGLPRQIEHQLWMKPASRKKLKQYFSRESAETIDKAIELLIKEKRIEEEKGRITKLRVTRREARLVKDDWLSRIDAVENFMLSVTNTVFHRFYGDEEASLARTVNFRIRRQDLGKLRELYEETIWPRLMEIEQATEEYDDVIDLDLSLCWSPPMPPRDETLKNKGKNKNE